MCNALQMAGVRYAICGGLAVAIHGYVRMTKDIDVLVDTGDVERACEAIAPLGFKFRALPMVFEEGTSRERHVQGVSKLEGTAHVVVDLLVATPSLAGVLDDRIEVVLDVGTLSVVSLPSLIKMKRLAGRTQDLADLENIEKLVG